MKTTFILRIILLTFTLFAGTRANAAIIYSGYQNVSYSQFSDPGTFSLFGAPGTWDDIRLQVHVFEDPGFQNRYEFGNILEVHGNYVEFAVGSYFFDIKRFTSGDLIDASSNWSGNNYKDFSDYTHSFEPHEFILENGEFRNATGYAGLRLTDGENIYYGWMQVSITNYDNSGITATLIDWAYENTPGQGIYAGMVPEPATAALLFGGTATLLIALRRRRKGSNTEC